MSKKIKLPNSGLEVEVISMSWDDSEAYMEKEKTATGSEDPTRAVGHLALETVTKYYPEQVEQIKEYRQDVTYLFKQIIQATFGNPEEEKN